MRRWLAVSALASTAAVVLSGCSGSDGGADQVAHDLAPVARPTMFVPEAGTCHPAVDTVVYASTYQPVDCGTVHLAETVDVAAFEGEDAAQADKPAAGSPALRGAWHTCARKANDFVGGDWHAGRLVLTLVMPSQSAWSTGSRWYRCDLSETDSLDNTKPVGRTGTLRGALAADSPLAYACFDPKMIKAELNYLEQVACTSTHHAEFAGIYTAPESSWDAFQKAGKATHRACMATIASFAKVPDDADLPFRAGSIFYPPSAEEWTAGDRGVRCFLWVGDRPLTRSVKGGGPQALPAG